MVLLMKSSKNGDCHMVKKKRCCRCRVLKLLTEFHKDRCNKDGLSYECKTCKAQYRLSYYKRNRGRILRRQREDTIKNPWRMWAKGTISYHRTHGIKVDLTMDQLESIARPVKRCYICGHKLAWGKAGGGPSFDSPSLDRIDNGQTINLDNIAILCNQCNITKGNRTMKKFIDYCERIAIKFRK